ncbi:MAG: ABC transporter ATP-binding protein [Clostridia bacterium]
MNKYLFRSKKLFSVIIILIILSSTLNVLLAFLFQYIIDIGISRDLDKFQNGIILAICFVIAEFIISFLSKVLNAEYIKKSIIYIRQDIFSGILKKNISAFVDENSSRFISTLTNDITMIEQDYFKSTFAMIKYVFLFVFALISLIRINYFIAVLILVLGWIPLIVPQIFAKKIEKLKKNYSDSISIFTSKIKDMFSGFEVIKSFDIETKVSNEFQNYNIHTEKSKFRFVIFSGLVDSVAGFFGTSMFITTLVVGTYYAINKSMTIGTLIAALQLMNYIIDPLVNIAYEWNKIKSTNLIYKSLNEIISVTDNDEGVTQKESLDSVIEFKNVNFGYDEKQCILNNINLQIHKNKKYAIIGESGGGKSTILKLLLKYYNNYTGEISIDGYDLRNINTSSLYNLLSAIHQNVFLFDASIKDNIDLYQGYSSKDINTAIERSGLQALIQNLPEGSNSNVGENGCNLSGGEKQRVSIARALIKNAQVIILDEGTSSLDNITAYNIEKSILNLEEVTAIIVTHKFFADLLIKYDWIFVMKKGEIIEQGTFSDLIKGNGYFKSLYSIENEVKIDKCQTLELSSY